MERWRQTVGAPIALDLAHHKAVGSESSSPDDARNSNHLVILSWNVWIGQGRLRTLVSRIRNGDMRHLGAEPEAGLIILLQEAYRSDSTVPRLPHRRPRGLLPNRGHTPEDVVETAHAVGMSLRYAPSMRNGLPASDRGNAILSTLPLEDAHAVELPLVLQRRVAVLAAAVVGGRRIRLISAHLDPRGPPGHQWLGAAGRELQANHLVASVADDTVILGADLNLGRGRYEPAWRRLGEAGFTFGVPASVPAWRHTFHALPRLVLDYLLVRNRAGIIARAGVHRLDEHPNDRGPRVFGSDHHPLLARIDFKV